MLNMQEMEQVLSTCIQISDAHLGIKIRVAPFPPVAINCASQIAVGVDAVHQAKHREYCFISTVYCLAEKWLTERWLIHATALTRGIRQPRH